MLRIDGLTLSPGQDAAQLKVGAARALGVKPGDITTLQILRRSIDARREVKYVHSVAVALAKGVRPRKKAAPYAPERYALPPAAPSDAAPPVVVGAGPAGLFAALVLAKCGRPPILLERGQCAEVRQETVARFWRTGELDTECNVQFGEGGAGAFSDGKLNTGTRDVRHRFILEEMVQNGAPETILYDAKPHVGTDYLHVMLQNLRRELLALGTDIRFGHKLTGLQTEDGHLSALTVTGPDGPYTLPCRRCILALGHSARDTVETLYAAGVPMEAKPFAMGVRIEHRQADMDAQQYKAMAGHPGLPASTYKLACHVGDRGVFSFCVCPGGQVVAAASEVGRAVTNGMSEYARDRENCNGGLLVSVTPDDFPSSHPLAGYALQRELEANAYALGGGDYVAPAQRVEDFLRHRPSTGPGRVIPSYTRGVKWCDLHDCLPPWMTESLEAALPLLDGKLPGFAHPDAVLTAVESRSSSPVRIPRGEDYQSTLRGLFPCGEGAGYAGGILSAAADGMRCAEQLLADERQ